MRIFLAICAAITVALPAVAQRAGAYYNRLDFKEWSVREQNIYASGVSDALTTGAFAGVAREKQNAYAACLQDKDITNTQIRLTALKLIDEAPEQLHFSASGVVIDAILLICNIK